MIVSIRDPEVLQITDDASQQMSFGGDQEWYSDPFHRMAGCGPTCAANISAYLALTRSHLRPLYSGEDTRKSSFSTHMESLYGFVTPGNMGLNRTEMFTSGIAKFAESRGIPLEYHVFEVRGNMSRDRQPVSELERFILKGLEQDCPIAFLNLSKGRVKNLQAWHWITITGADIGDSHLRAFASDEGKQICIDLKLWYLSTRMRGGLIYFSVGERAAKPHAGSALIHQLY